MNDSLPPRRKPTTRTAPKEASALTSKVDASGLHYLKKDSGSIFPSNTHTNSGRSLSCFFCGKHRGSLERMSQKIMGKSQQVCNPACDQNVVLLRQRRKEAESQAQQGL